LPKGLDEIFSRFRSVLVPEMNMGQMARVLRSEYQQHNFISYPKVQGLPFRTSELVEKINSILEK
jgi:2-oxoglutarate ferredoxin oxidoreductase subunit alpha